MGIKSGYSSVSTEREYHQYICSHCEKLLGVYERSGEYIRDDIEGWNYCPYCGCELD